MEIFLVLLGLCQILVGLLGLNFQTGRQGTKHAFFERFDSTCGDRNVIGIFSYDSMLIEGTKLIFNSTINVKEEVHAKLRSVLHIERCNNRENLDTCEHFYEHKVEEYCDTLVSNNSLWGPLYQSYVPTYRCPIKKGTYRAINSTFDVSALLLFPIDVWYWKVKVEVFQKNSNRRVSCMIVEARMSALARRMHKK